MSERTPEQQAQMETLLACERLLSDRSKVLARKAQEIHKHRGACYESIALESDSLEADNCAALVIGLMPSILRGELVAPRNVPSTGGEQ
jgi:hypothetical protein